MANDWFIVRCMKMSAKPLATSTLIITPQGLRDFGRDSRSTGSFSRMNRLYQQAVLKCFRPVSRAKTVPEFGARWKTAITNYSEFYGKILRVLVVDIGSSRFKLEYVKQVAKVSKELKGLSFGAHDLAGLFQRHVACSNKIASNYDLLFEEDPDQLETIDLQLRTSNYGLTFLVLLLQQRIESPLWIMLEVNDRILDSLMKLECMPEIQQRRRHLSGSLKFSQGNLDLPQPGARE